MVKSGNWSSLRRLRLINGDVTILKVKKANLCLCLTENLALNAYGGLELHIEACLTSTLDGGAVVNILHAPAILPTDRKIAAFAE